MSTTATLSFRRFVRRVNSGQVTNTQWLGAMASAAELVKSATWIESPTTAAVLPVNVPTTSDFSADKYDCFKQSGAASANTGTQCVFAGMSIYRIAIPTAASATYISSVTFRAASDKFCVGGLKVAAILLNSATPPEDWSILRMGGAGGTVDTTGAFSTVGTVDTESIETAGILAETATTVSTSSNHAGEFTLDLSGVTDGYAYLFIAVSLFDYETQRREYWVEGSGAIDGASISVTFAADGLEIESTNYDVRLPLHTLGNAKIVEFSGSNGNLYNSYLRMDWGLRMLVGGRISESSTTPYTSASSVTTLTPQLKLNGLNTIMRGCIVECYCARKELSGYNLYLSLSSNCIGTSPFRISVIASTDQPDITLADTWGGILAGCIGTAIFSGGSLGDTLTIPITANPTSTRLWIVASLVDIAAADTAAISLGFADYLGISVEDAHIAAKPLDVSYSAPAEGLKSYAHSSTSSGMMFNLLRNENIYPYQFEQFYAINSNGSATSFGTSYGAWKLWGTSDPIATLPDSRSLICAGNGFFLAHSYNNIYYAGDISSLDDTIAFTPKNINALAVAYDGFITANSDNTVTCHGTACLSLLNASVGTWTGVDLIISSGVTGAIGAFKVVALKSDGTLFTHGYDASAKSTLEGLTGVAWVVLSNVMTVIFKTDGSAIVYKGVAPYFKIVTVVPQSWTNIKTLGAAYNAAFCISGVSPPYSVSILTEAGATTLDWFDPTTLPSGRSPAFIIGSDYSRLALGYTE